jgi:hypothetical protein
VRQEAGASTAVESPTSPIISVSASPTLLLQELGINVITRAGNVSSAHQVEIR